MKTCEEIQGYLIDRMLGEDLSGAIEVELRHHLSQCSVCRKRLEEFDGVRQSLEKLGDIRFPENISRDVIQAVESKDKPGTIRFSGFFFSGRRVAVLALAASLLLIAGLFILFRGDNEADHPIIDASIFVSGEVSEPDLAVTMDNYLNEAENILGGIREGTYNNWGLILSEIVSRDIQGRANFLLENPALPPPVRLVIGVLHDAFWEMLRYGRDHEDDEVRLPPGVDPAALLAEIDQARSNFIISERKQ
ncbi:MAG: zf-HC2 domain-containing protein [Candidatus Auribacterota bacterium]|nr:zf-HC2 domain-containing protein [Candidatus Auribacterota bacterium]